ncbi:MAG TPA: porin family protein [Puia sp.]|nr:porin family protein [Puia sp.]
MSKTNRIVSVSLIFILNSYFLFAQQTDKATFGFGAGLNYSNVVIHAENAFSPYRLPGFKGYIFITGPMGKGFYIQPEISYENMGWQYDGPDNFHGGNYSNVKTYLNYLFLSILPKYKFPNSKFSIILGPSYGLLLSANTKGYQGETYNVKDGYVSGNFGATIGAEYYLPLGIGFSARYFAGISNLVSEPIGGDSMHSSVLSFSVSYKLYSH